MDGTWNELDNLQSRVDTSDSSFMLRYQSQELISDVDVDVRAGVIISIKLLLRVSENVSFFFR